MVGSFVIQIMTKKKGTVVWLLVGMFGSSMSSDCFGRFLDQDTTRKKGTVVWPLVAISDCFGRFVTMLFGGFLDKITNYNRKKRYSHLAISWNVYYILLTYYTLVDRLSAMKLWAIYPGRKIPALT